MKGPMTYASSSHYIAFSTGEDDGLHVFTIDVELVHIVPDSTGSTCADFKASDPEMLGIGFLEGSVRKRDGKAQEFVSSFKAQDHRSGNTCACEVS